MNDTLKGTSDKEVDKVEKNRYCVLWREQEQQALFDWWQNLNKTKLGDRAKLRRCETPEAVLLQQSFYELQRYFPKTSTLALAAVAGLLAHVKQPSELNFPKQLGQQKEQSGKAIFSELRFQQLLASRDIDELYENLRRAVMQTSRTANIFSLADGVLHWAKEHQDNNQFDERPERRFQFTWAKAYFSEVLTYSKS